MQKLIKLSDTHYVIVDDSEIKENDFYLDGEKKILQAKEPEIGFANWLFSKITHSTLSLYSNDFWAIGELRLSEVKEVIKEYDVDKMAEEYLQKWKSIGNIHLSNIIHAERCKNDYKAGFNAYKELMKDKLFTIGDIKNAIAFGVDTKHTTFTLILTMKKKQYT